MDGSTLGVKKKFKEYRVKTDNFTHKIEQILINFEKDKDSQKLYEGIKESVERFTNSES